MQKDQKLHQIDVNDIIITGNNPRGVIEPESCRELADDIENIGALIHPITVRPLGDKFELIAGERRLTAYKLKNWKKIDALVLDVDDDTAYLISVVENLQRQDIHPLDEANALQELVQRIGLQAAIAKTGKNEKFITRRIQLNQLSSKAMYLFRTGFFEIGHCMELARLTHKLQDQLIEKIVQKQGNGREQITFARPVKWLQKYVEDELLMNLKNVPWSLDDAELLKKAGACSTCVKNTACSAVLFAEFADTARCSDRECFDQKKAVFLKKTVNELMDDGHDVYLLTSEWLISNSDRPDIAEVKGILTAGQFQIVKDKAATTGVFFSDDKFGKIVNFIKPGEGKKAVEKKKTSVNIDEQKKVVQSRLARGEELDRQKVFNPVSKLIGEHKVIVDKKSSSQPDLCDAEVALFLYVVTELGGYKFDFDEMFFEVDLSKPEQMKKKFVEIYDSNQLISKYIRSFIHSQLQSVNVEHNPFVYEMYLQIAEHLGIEQVKTILSEQQEVREKRKKRAESAIKKLQEEVVKKTVKKPTSPAKKSKTKKPASGVKKAVRKSSTKKTRSESAKEKVKPVKRTSRKRK